MDAITLGIALLGAALGLSNLWREIDRARIKLRVRPQGWVDSLRNHGLCIDVVNRSEYAVTIVAVGIKLRGDKKLEWQFLPIDPNARCPHRLEPRDSVSFRAKPGAEQDQQLLERGDRAFARTACGCTVTATSPYLRSLLARRKTRVE
ncbi:hypothetical protein [Opitutus terrae]|uniref:Uncharacterized protein n=1 Tax=Opitutus terrae (strain DSM 11246 / JCM 15787 / PB90-1) TaxID=452637 RepID=B1ZUB8_OPITP|nr:hypothetical protein [Opitutus terrae]ACB76680.1 hypothetical protein Oter_3403 [Opitutus terrae PB90-1]